jgi:Tfp pilus assembly protein PilP
MISRFIFFIHKSFMYLVSMMGALVLAYSLGLNPLLKAQTQSQQAQTQLEKMQSQSGSAEGLQKATIVSGTQTLTPQTMGKSEELSSLPNQLGALSGVQNSKYSEGELDNAEIELLNKAQKQESSSKTQNGSSGSTSAPNSKVQDFQYSKSYIGDLNTPERDPFRKPEYLLRIEEEELRPKTPVNSFIRDDKMEAIRRWQVDDYKLIGVIWDVKNPKAMVVDPAGTKHLIRRNYRIGNKNGLVSEIGEGSITVLQDGVPIVMNIVGEKK